MIHRVKLLAIFFLAIVETGARAETPASSEMLERDRFVARFPGAVGRDVDVSTGASLFVEERGGGWYDRVQQNAGWGYPFRIGRSVYYRGLFCHAPSRVVVRLPSGGKFFQAVAGISARYADVRATVEFSVEVGKETRYRSETVRKTSDGTVCEANLEGAREFTLAVTDGGDGINGDHAVWADAHVTLENGSRLWLADLPILDGQSPDMNYKTVLPFSFDYGGRPVHEILSDWDVGRVEIQVDRMRTRQTTIHTDPVTGLQVTTELTLHADYPVADWTVRLRNTGEQKTPVISKLVALDAQLESLAGVQQPFHEYQLRRIRGDMSSPQSYEPLDRALEPGATLRLAPRGGRPTGGEAPFFNLEWLSGGAIVSIGWPGQWVVEFVRDGGTGLRVRAGQEQIHLSLLPGEEIRTPRIVMLFWKGEWIRAQNLWRRWMKDHNMPRPGGELVKPLLLASAYRIYHEMTRATEENQLAFLQRYADEKLGLDCLWMDAGWYKCDGIWGKVGTWEVDRERFPHGLKPITDLAHSMGKKALVWFEPERVTPNSWIAVHHPEWLLGDPKPAHGRLLDLGNPDAVKWLTDHIDTFMKREGIDHYRQDFNFSPLDYWRANDAEDRQGITENHHVRGYLQYYDELLRRDPARLIDTCASGGQRCDIETLRRAVPLWRSDYVFDPVGMQCMTYGLSFWIPYHGTGTVAHAAEGYYGKGIPEVDPYSFWSNAFLSINSGLDVRQIDADYDTLRRLFGQWKTLAPNFLGDYYPLTPYSQEDWMVWQFHRPESKQGMVQAFHREVGIYESVRLSLRGLDAEVSYLVESVETGEKGTKTGRELMRGGLVIPSPGRPGVAVIAYRAQ